MMALNEKKITRGLSMSAKIALPLQRKKKSVSYKMKTTFESKFALKLGNTNGLVGSTN